jgi:hypothetical protein
MHRTSPHDTDADMFQLCDEAQLLRLRSWASYYEPNRRKGTRGDVEPNHNATRQNTSAPCLVDWGSLRLSSRFLGNLPIPSILLCRPPDS